MGFLSAKGLHSLSGQNLLAASQGCLIVFADYRGQVPVRPSGLDQLNELSYGRGCFCRPAGPMST